MNKLCSVVAVTVVSGSAGYVAALSVSDWDGGAAGAFSCRRAATKVCVCVC